MEESSFSLLNAKDDRPIAHKDLIRFSNIDNPHRYSILQTAINTAITVIP